MAAERILLAVSLVLVGCALEEDLEPEVGDESFAASLTYTPPADGGYGVPPPSLASSSPGGATNGSNNDLGYCHGGYCINSVVGGYGQGRKIRFNANLVYYRNDPNLHQVLARAFHPYYVTRKEKFSAEECIGGWRLCSPPAVYDMAVRKITSCSGMPTDCVVGAWTFQMIHSYLWGNQVSGVADHCGDAEGNVVVIRVDPNDAATAYVWYVDARDDPDPLHALYLDFTGAHPQFTNHRDDCWNWDDKLPGCQGSHHKQYARRTADGDAHGWSIDSRLVFFHPGIEFDYKHMVDPSLTCVMPAHGYLCYGYANEGHDSNAARCNEPPYAETVTLSTNVAGAFGPWGDKTEGYGAFYGGYLNVCPLTMPSKSGWGIGLNASWTYGDPGARAEHPKGAVDNIGAWTPDTPPSSTSYTTSPAAHSSYPDSGGELTNGATATGTDWASAAGWLYTNPSVKLDLGSVQNLGAYAIYVGNSHNNGSFGVARPASVAVYGSSDNVNFSYLGAMWFSVYSDAGSKWQVDRGELSASTSARYIRFDVTAGGAWVMITEVAVGAGGGGCVSNTGAACDGADGDACQEGTIQCNGSCSDATSTTSEVCGNGIDDDCTGGDCCVAYYGQACDGSDGDSCAEGTYACNGSCSDTTGTTSEVCGNGIDDDCTGGDTDCCVYYEGWGCDGSDGDYCYEGSYACNGSCSDWTGTTYEVCGNGVDDDCTGGDESCAPPPPPSNSCSGACGGQGSGYCWCDSYCVQYGDCCADACYLCGQC